jgi:hypothetical protein
VVPAQVRDLVAFERDFGGTPQPVRFTGRELTFDQVCRGGRLRVTSAEPLAYAHTSLPDPASGQREYEALHTTHGSRCGSAGSFPPGSCSSCYTQLRITAGNLRHPRSGSDAGPSPQRLRQRWPLLRRLGCDDEFARCCARLHVSVGFGDVVEAVDPVDRYGHASGGHVGEEVLEDVGAQVGGTAAVCSQADAAWDVFNWVGPVLLSQLGS